MSIYGEGEYACSQHGYTVLAPGPRSEQQLRARQWEPICPRCGEELAARATPEHKPLIPTSVYAITKRDQEELCLVVGAAYGIPTTALRFFNVYGEGQALSNPYTGAAAIFASRILNGEMPVLFEDGQQTRDFIHVSDIVEGIVLALDADADGQAINLGTGIPTPIADIAAILAVTLNQSRTPEPTGEYRVGDIRHCYAATTKARTLLGFKARVDVSDGMRDLGLWLAEQAVPTDNVLTAKQELIERGLIR